MEKKSLNEANDMDLMLYADGEESSASELFLKTAESKAKLMSLGQIGDVLRTTVQLEQDEFFKEGVPKESMWEAIESRIQQSDVANTQGVTRSQTKEVKGQAPLTGLRRWFSGWQSHLVTGALAAGAVFLFTQNVPNISSKDTTASASGSEAGAGARPMDGMDSKSADASDHQANLVPVAFQDDLESQPPEVEHLEVFDGEGMVLTIPGEHGDTAVIWVSKDRDVKGPL